MCMVAIYDFDFQRILTESIKVPIDRLRPQLKSLLTNYGLVPPETIREVVLTCVPDMTFEEVYKKFPRKIYIAAHCVELAQTHYFSVVTHPQMSIVDALCMSISVPIIFSSFKHGPWTYFDGGVTETAPCGHLLGEDDVMILRIKYDDSFVISDVTSYMQLVFQTLLKMRKVYPYPTFVVNLGNTNLMDFKADEILKMKLYVKGYNFLDK